MTGQELKIFVKFGDRGYWFKCEERLSSHEAGKVLVAIADPHNRRGKDRNKVWVEKARVKE